AGGVPRSGPRRTVPVLRERQGAHLHVAALGTGLPAGVRTANGRAVRTTAPWPRSRTARCPSAAPPSLGGGHVPAQRYRRLHRGGVPRTHHDGPVPRGHRAVHLPTGSRQAGCLTFDAEPLLAALSLAEPVACPFGPPSNSAISPSFSMASCNAACVADSRSATVLRNSTAAFCCLVASASRASASAIIASARALASAVSSAISLSAAAFLAAISSADCCWAAAILSTDSCSALARRSAASASRRSRSALASAASCSATSSAFLRVFSA